jgi:hypothetical protein
MYIFFSLWSIIWLFRDRSYIRILSQGDYCYILHLMQTCKEPNNREVCYIVKVIRLQNTIESADLHLTIQQKKTFFNALNRENSRSLEKTCHSGVRNWWLLPTFLYHLFSSCWCYRCWDAPAPHLLLSLQTPRYLHELETRRFSARATIRVRWAWLSHFGSPMSLAVVHNNVGSALQ